LKRGSLTVSPFFMQEKTHALEIRMILTFFLGLRETKAIK
jgi:hypothetical protein